MSERILDSTHRANRPVVTRTTPFEQLPTVLTAAEVATLLGFTHTRFVYDLIARGDIPATQWGRRWWVSREALRGKLGDIPAAPAGRAAIHPKPILTHTYTLTTRIVAEAP